MRCLNHLINLKIVSFSFQPNSDENSEYIIEKLKTFVK